MEQRDYLLREIEKIGAIIRAIRQRLFGGTDESAISVGDQAEALKEMLLDEAYLDLDEILDMDTAATDDYLARMKGFNVENIELLARTIADIGMTGWPKDRDLSGRGMTGMLPANITAGNGSASVTPVSFALLEKALQLYEICNRRDRTFSFEREAAVSQLREMLQYDRPD